MLEAAAGLSTNSAVWSQAAAVAAATSSSSPPVSCYHQNYGPAAAAAAAAAAAGYYSTMDYVGSSMQQQQLTAVDPFGCKGKLLQYTHFNYSFTGKRTRVQLGKARRQLVLQYGEQLGQTQVEERKKI